MTAKRSSHFNRLVLVLGLGLVAAPSLLMMGGQASATLTTLPATSATSAPATTRSISDRDRRKQEEIDRVMEFFRVTQPDVWEQARTLRDSNPKQFEELIQRAGPTVRRLEDLHKSKPKLFELTMKDLELNYRSLRLARELKKPDLSPADKAKVQKDLQDTVSEQFDMRQKIRQYEIDEQAQKIRDLEQQMKDREKIKAELIKKRVDDLQDKPPKLEW